MMLGLWSSGYPIESVRRVVSATTRLRLQLHALAYNPGKFLRTLALPDGASHRSLTTLREKLIKIGTKVVRRAPG